MLDFSDFPSIKSPIGFFEEISKIPHGSGNTKGIADYIEGFAKERGLFCIRDSLDNLIIRKPATPGYENKPGVIFQGHTDMVAEKTPNANIDMQKEGLRLYRDGDFLRADGTTLGGDDGIAVAYALAILDSKDIEHPEFEAVFTTDEEVGLTGAKGIDLSPLHGRILVNLDCDNEGIFTVGCAGGVRCDITRSFELREASGEVCAFCVSDLRGGHSGGDINKDRLNSIKELGRALSMLGDIRLISLDCGNADNAIPRDASVTFISEKPITELVGKVAAQMKSSLISAGETDADINYAIITENGRAALSKEDSQCVIAMINELRSGVLGMSRDIEGLVETSQNLGIATLFDGKLSMTVSVRSSVEEKKSAAVSNIRKFAEEYAALLTQRSDYPGWAYRKESYLRDKMSEVYRDMYGKDPLIVAVHAGLECGILIDKIPELDCVAMGPDNFDIHTPNEHLSLPSFARVWEYLKELLKRI